MKLGKLAPKEDARNFQLKKYLAAELPTPTRIFGFGSLYANWGMLGNNLYGDCVFAGAAHETMLWNLRAGHPVEMNTDNTLADYSDVTGFDPTDPSTDQGAYVLDALKYRRSTGVRDATGGRHKIAAYVQLDPSDWDQLILASYIFGAVGIGFNFPDSAWEQFDNGEYWDVVDPDGGIDGGHYVPVVGSRNSSARVTVVTWARRQQMTKRFYEKYCTTPEYRTLTADLRWVPVGDLRVGDKLLAFNEQHTRSGRFYEEASVLSVQPAMAETYDVEVSTGQIFRVTADHRWLAGKNNGGFHWVATKPGYGKGGLCAAARSERADRRSASHGERYATKLYQLIEPWSSHQTYGDGWLAGILDGEGYVTQPHPYGLILGFAQNEGVILDRALDELARLGCLSSVRVWGGPVSGGGAVATQRKVRNVQIWGRTMMDRVALLGRVRPSRLLEKLDINRLGRVERRLNQDHVVDVRKAGRHEITQVTTSSGTMIVEGYPMHNCDETWAILSEEQLKNGLGIHGLDLEQLEADLAAL